MFYNSEVDNRSYVAVVRSWRGEAMSWMMLLYVLLGPVCFAPLVWAGNYAASHTYSWKVFLLDVGMSSLGLMAVIFSITKVLVASVHVDLAARPQSVVGGIAYAVIVGGVFALIVLRNHSTINKVVET